MRGTSAASLEAVARRFEPVLVAAGTQGTVIGEELFAVVDALDSSASLRGALSDPARSSEAKEGLVVGLLSGRVDDRVIDLLADLSRARWSSEDHLPEAVEQIAADAVLAAAQSTGSLEQVGSEIFRLGRLLVGQRDLRRALTDGGAPAPSRASLVSTLIGGKVHPVTLQLVERAAFAPRGRTMVAMLLLLGRLAARRRELLIALVTTASAFSPEQERRLMALLERTYGRRVRLNVSVDPEVVGGLRMEVGSEVVDATVLARLDEARRRMAG